MGRSFVPALSHLIAACSFSHSAHNSHLITSPCSFRRFFTLVSTVCQHPVNPLQRRPPAENICTRILASRRLQSCSAFRSSGNRSYFGEAFMCYLHHMTSHPYSTTAINGACEGQENKEKISVTFVDKDGEEKTINVPLGMSMLEAAHENDIELEGIEGEGEKELGFVKEHARAH